MARIELTLATTRPNPKRWWRRVALVAFALGVSALIVIAITSRGQISIGAGALFVVGSLAYRLRKEHEPLYREHGAATYKFRAGVATFETTDGDEIHLSKGDVRAVELTAADALVLARRDGTTVRLMAANRGALVRVADDLGHAQAIVRRVEGGSAVSRLASEWKTASHIAYAVLLVFTFVLCSIAGMDASRGRFDPEPIVGAVSMLTLAAVGLLAFRGTEIRVGADGVSYRVLVRPRFLSHARVEHVKQGDRGVWLTLDDGREVLLPTTGIATARLAEYIQEARDAARESSGEAPLGALLDRGARSLDEWKRAVMTVAVNSGGYRMKLVTPAQLRRVVDDGGASPERRVAAALALRNATGKKKRILIAARSSADEALRVALEAAAEGEVDEEALEQAMRHFRTDA